MKTLITLIFMGIVVLTNAQQLNYSYNGSNGSGGLSDYGIVTQANGGQALLGAEGNGDSYANLNLGSNISGTRRFWHISKRVASDAHSLHFYYYDGTTFQGPSLALHSNGRIGMGTVTPGNYSKLNVVGGGIEVSNAAHQLDASLHISTSYGQFGRLTQINPSAVNSHALNLMASTDVSGNLNWWSWGVLSTGAWALQPSTSFGGSTGMFIDRSGNVGIGTPSPNQKLTVNGTIYGKEVKVDLSVPGPDYVFEKSYDLLSLDEVKSYIDENKHLPEVPSAKEMEKNGINLSEMNMLLLKKVEELTLYILQMKNENDELKKRVILLEEK